MLVTKCRYVFNFGQFDHHYPLSLSVKQFHSPSHLFQHKIRYQHSKVVTVIKKSSPTFSHQHHDVASITVTVFNFISLTLRAQHWLIFSNGMPKESLVFAFIRLSYILIFTIGNILISLCIKALGNSEVSVLLLQMYLSLTRLIVGDRVCFRGYILFRFTCR